MDKKLLEKYERDLTIKGYSKKTKDACYRNIIYFFNYADVKPKKVTREIVKDYLYYLIAEKKLSSSSLIQARAAIVYFYTQTFPRPGVINDIPQVKRKRKTPSVFTVNEVFEIINSAANLKYKTILMLIYSSGLRIGECVSLKVSDIRRDLMRVDVREAKGGLFRSTVLSSLCLKQLDLYLKEYNPADWLFAGNKEGTHLTTRSVEEAFNRAKKNAQVK